MNNYKAISLVEIIVVIIIMGVLVSMAIPNYLLGLSRSSVRASLDNLLAIHTAQIMYAQANGRYYSSSTSPSEDASGINKSLRLNITPIDVSYYCDSTAVCHAAKSGTGGFDLAMNLRIPINQINNKLIYCNVAGPDNSYNPCCIIPDGGSQVSGETICPSN